MPSQLPDFISTQVSAAQRFYHSVEGDSNRGLKVICGGWEECTAEYRIDRDTFPYFSVEFVAAGEGELELNGEKHALKPGMVFSYAPGIAHRIRSSAENRLRKYFVDFSGRRAKSLLTAAQLAPGAVVQLTASGEVKSAFDTLLRLAEARHRGVAEISSLQLEILLLAIKYATEPVLPSERRALATFERCRQQIEAEALRLRTVEQAAALCHIDVSYLSRLFHRFHGVPPLRYIQTLQMQWAAHRLHSTGDLVRQVADDLGIDAFQFSRTFKRIHGVSPTAFLATRR
jgi:AraC-like DNA-binding protein